MEKFYQQVQLQEISESDVFKLQYAVPWRKFVLPVCDADVKQQKNLIRMELEEYFAENYGLNIKNNEISILIDITLAIRKNIDKIESEKVRELTLTEQSHIRKAFYNLNYYEPRDNSNIEKVQGYLEAFHHLCELSEWEEASKIFEMHMDTPTQEALHYQLKTWGYYREQIELYSRLLGKLSDYWDEICLSGLGDAYCHLGLYNQGIDYYQQCLAIAKEIGDRAGEGKALGNLGSACTSLGQFRQARDYYQQSLAIAREIGDRASEKTTLGNLGTTYINREQLTQAIDCFQQHLAISREIGDRAGEGKALGNLGSACTSLGQFRQARDYYQQSLAIAREIGDRASEGRALGNLGGNLGATCINRGQLTEAIDYFQQSLAIAREIGDRPCEGTALGNLGVAYNFLGKYQKAIDYVQQSLALAREIGDRGGEKRALINLGQAYLRCGKLQKGLAAIVQGQNILPEIGLTVTVILYPNWLKSLVKFSERGWWQKVLVLVACPFIWVVFLAGMLWWWGRDQVCRRQG